MDELCWLYVLISFSSVLVRFSEFEQKSKIGLIGNIKFNVELPLMAHSGPYE